MVPDRTVPMMMVPTIDVAVRTPADVMIVPATTPGTLTMYVPAAPVPDVPLVPKELMLVPAATLVPVRYMPAVIVPVTVPVTVSKPVAPMEPENDTAPAVIMPVKVTE